MPRKPSARDVCAKCEGPGRAAVDFTKMDDGDLYSVIHQLGEYAIQHMSGEGAVQMEAVENVGLREFWRRREADLAKNLKVGDIVWLTQDGYKHTGEWVARVTRIDAEGHYWMVPRDDIRGMNATELKAYATSQGTTVAEMKRQVGNHPVPPPGEPKRFWVDRSAIGWRDEWERNAEAKFHGR